MPRRLGSVCTNGKRDLFPAHAAHSKLHRHQGTLPFLVGAGASGRENCVLFFCGTRVHIGPLDILRPQEVSGPLLIKKSLALCSSWGDGRVSGDTEQGKQVGGDRGDLEPHLACEPSGDLEAGLPLLVTPHTLSALKLNSISRQQTSPTTSWKKICFPELLAYLEFKTLVTSSTRS